MTFNKLKKRTAVYPMGLASFRFPGLEFEAYNQLPACLGAWNLATGEPGTGTGLLTWLISPI